MAQPMLYTVLLTAWCLVELSQSQGRNDFYVGCPYSFNHVYWVRYPNTVLETYWNGYIEFTSLGRDLRGRTQVYFYSGLHTIRIRFSNDDMDSYWHCCILDYNYIWYCSDWVFIKGRSIITSTGGGPMVTSFTPTNSPAMVLIDGKLSLTSYPESPSEGQDLTLSCTTDADIDEAKWVVTWFRNNTPVFITNTTSSSTEAGGVILVRNRTDDIIQSINDVTGGISVATNAHQQNVTLPVSTSLIGISVWSCGNPYMSNMSNSLTIEVVAEAGTNASSVTTTSSTRITATTATDTSARSASATLTTTATSTIATNTTPADGNATVTAETLGLSVSPSASTQEDGISTMTYIVIGSISGIVLLVLLVAMVMCIFRRRTRNFKSYEMANTSQKDRTKEDTVMEDNVLYAGTVPDNSYHDNEAVMEDNVLYEGSQDMSRDNHDNDERVMEDNVLYEGSQDMSRDNHDNDERVMEDNVLYMSSDNSV